MPKRSIRPVTLRETWRPKTAGSFEERRSIFVRRVLFSLILLAVCAFFAYLLFRPFYHPNVRLFYFSGGDYSAPHTTPVPFFREDAVRFLSSDGYFDEQKAEAQFKEWLTPKDAFASIDTISHWEWRADDLPIIYLSGRATMVDGRPCLHAENLNLGNLSASAITFEDLFNKIASISSSRILLLMDVDTISVTTYEDQTSDLLDSVSELLARPNLSKIWAISSHSSGERCNVSTIRRSSAFMDSVVRALSGEGSLGNDQRVSFYELYRFVSSETKNLIQAESQDRIVQTPRLLGDPKRNEKPVDWIVASVPAVSWKARVEAIQKQVAETAKATGEATSEQDVALKQKEKEEGWLSKYAAEKSERVQGRVADEISDNLDLLPSFIADPIKVKIGLRPDLAEETPGKPAEADPEAAAKLQLPDGPDLRKLPAAINDLVELLQLARQYCTYVETNPKSRFKPWESMPIAWSYTLGKLNNIENRMRYKAIANPDVVKTELVSLIVALHQLATEGKTKLDGELASWREQIAKLDDSQIPAISLSTWQRSLLFSDASNSANAFLQAFDDALSQPAPKPLVELLQQPTANANGDLLEVFHAKRLVQDSQIPWELTRRCLRILRQLDQQASSSAASNREFADTLRSAFAAWLSGYRVCVDRVQSNWELSAAEKLDSAEEELKRCSDFSNTLQLSKQLWYRVHDQMEGWIEQYSQSSTGDSNLSTVQNVLEQILQYQVELTERLIHLESTTISDLQRAFIPLSEQVDALDDYWRDSAKNIESTEWDSIAHEYWQIQDLLNRDYYWGPERDRLLKRWLAWAGGTLTVPPPPVSDRLIEAPTRSEAVNSLRDRFQRWKRETRVSQDLWADTSSIESLRTQESAVRLMKVYTSNQLNPRPLLESILKSEFAGSLQLRRDLYALAIRDSTTEERDYLLATDARLRESIASLVKNVSFSSITPSSIVADVVPNLSLESSREETVTLSLRNRSSVIQEVWLLVDYDPAVISIEPVQGETLYPLSTVDQRLVSAKQKNEELLAARLATQSAVDGNEVETQLRARIAALKTGARYPVDPTADEVPPTLALPPNTSKNIAVKIVRTDTPTHDQKIIWKTVTRSHYTRVESVVKLPTANPIYLVAETTGATWSSVGNSLQLDLFPNRPASAKFGVKSDGGSPGKYRVRLWLPTAPVSILLPPGELSVEATADVRSRLPGLTLWQEMPNVSVANSQKPLWLVPPPPPENPAAPKPAGGADASSSGAAASGATPAPKKFPMQYGIVVEMVDEESQRTLWRRVEVRTRHPRSYIDILSAYDSISETAELTLICREPSLIPPAGIPIVGRVRESLPKGTEAKLTGTLLPNSPLRLYCKVPVSSLRTLTIELDVEHYARAFVASIPCWRSFANAPVSIDRAALRFVNVLDETSIRPGVAVENVTLQVDALNETFLNEGDVLEVGWDEDQDREFDREAPLAFRADRQQRIEATSYSSKGSELLATVQDFQLTLPPPTAINRRINLLAKLSTSNQTAWSDPVVFIVDGDKPTIQGVEVRPSTKVPKGTDLELRVSATDAELSGIASVQAAIDTTGILRWSEAKNPVVGIRLDDGTWKIMVPTAESPPGRVTLVISATDRAGNASEIERRSLEIISDEDWQQMQANRKREIFGLITYTEKPVTNAKVSLAKENGDILTTIDADSRGLYKLPPVSAGKYKLIAVAVIKNRPRRFEEDITVSGETDAPIRRELPLK